MECFSTIIIYTVCCNHLKLPGQGITLHGLETERPEMKHKLFQIESFPPKVKFLTTTPIPYKCWRIYYLMFKDFKA
jgi:hypothetical protein